MEGTENTSPVTSDQPVNPFIHPPPTQAPLQPDYPFQPSDYQHNFSPQPPNHPPQLMVDSSYQILHIPDPPPYYSPQAPLPYQETTTATIVVQEQSPYTNNSNASAGDHCMTFSICVCALCCIFGSPLTLLCTFPAICTALQAKDLERQRKYTDAANLDYATILLNVIAFVFGATIFVLNIICYIIFI